MTNITNINSQRFTLNGISYYKNFLSQIVGDPVAGDVVRIVNAYDSKFELLRPTKISNISVNGLTYPNAVSLQMALLPILYSRGTLGDGNSAENGIVQMGPLEIIDSPSTPGSVALKIPIEPVLPIWKIGGIDYTKETETVIDIPAAAESKYRVDTIVANTANGFERIVGEERADVGVPPQLPYNVVIVTQINIYGDLVNDGDPTPPPPFPLDKFITKGSKRYRSYTLVSETSNTLMLSHEYTTHLLKNAAGSGIVKGFLSLNDSQSGYAYDGMDVYIKNFGAVDVTLKHNDSTATVPFWFANGQDLAVKQHEILHMKFNAGQNRVELLKIGGNGAAYSIASNQAAQELYLKDIDGNTISTISVAFLNNEGTTFFYNDATEKLELKNDAGEVLSEIPVSAFVSNMAVALELTGSELKLKDTEGNVLSTVTLTKSAVGLGNADNTSDMDKPVSTAQAAALALKANDADVVKLTGNQSINGEKSFNSLLKCYDGIRMFSGTYVSIQAGLYTALNIQNPTGYCHVAINSFQMGALSNAGNDGYFKTGDNSRKLFLNANGWEFYVVRTRVLLVSPTGKITIASGGDSDQWNTAYGWGNHASAGYATAAAIASAINALKDGVPTAGDTLAKLYTLILNRVSLTGAETVAGKKTFSTVPASSQDAASDNDLVRKSQMDSALAPAKNQRTYITHTASAPLITPAETFAVVRATDNGYVQIGVDNSTMANVGDWFDVDSVGTGGLYIDPLGPTTLEVKAGYLPQVEGRYGRLRVEKIAIGKYKVTGDLKKNSGGELE